MLSINDRGVAAGIPSLPASQSADSREKDLRDISFFFFLSHSSFVSVKVIVVKQSV